MYVCMYAQDVYSCAVLTSTATRLSFVIADAVVQKKMSSSGSHQWHIGMTNGPSSQANERVIKN